MGQVSRSTADAPTSGWEIPIIDRKRRLVGWTTAAPQYVGGFMRHPEAERLVGGAVVVTYVQIKDGADAQRAGAPLGWQGEWRCLGLCSESIVAGDGTWDDVQTVPGTATHH